MLVAILLLLTCGVAGFAQPSAPQNLHAAAATNRAVSLSWTASPGAAGYIVERRTLSEQQFKPLSAAATTEVRATDSSIDAFTTYVYRVKAVNSSKQASAASNEIRIGPPPVGLSAVVPTPAGLKDPDDNFAQVPQMVLDGNGDPAMIYYLIKGDRGADSELYFVAWDRAAYHWRTPVEVVKAGPVDITRPALPFSLAHDAETNTYGVAFPADRREGSSRSVAVALSSDGGATWEVKRVASGPDSRFGSASLAMGGGQVYLAWERDTTVQYAAGKPGLAYLALSADDYNTIVGFWRPGSAPVKVVDSNNIQNDRPKVRLDFQGTQPRVIVEIARTKANPRTGLTDIIWFVAAKDDGATWASLADPAAISAETQSLPVPPILSNGKTCSPLGTRKPKLRHADSGQIRYAANGNLYAIMANRTADTGDAPAPVGLILWREP